MGEAFIPRRGGAGNSEFEYHSVITLTSGKTITLDTKKNYRVFVVHTYYSTSVSSSGETKGYFVGTITAGSALTAEIYSCTTSTSYLVPAYNKSTGVLTIPGTGSSIYCCRAYVMETS